MTPKTKPCLVACSVFKDEIKKLIEQDELDAEMVFVSKYFHVDYTPIEKNLRPVIEYALQRYHGNVILVYGDLCLGMKDQMNKLAKEYGIVKIDALNCIDCQLGGKGKSLEVDPNQDLFFLSPGMMDFFRHSRDMMRKEGFEEKVIKELFKDLRGIVVLDTLGNCSKLVEEINELDTGLEILETRNIGCEGVKDVIHEAMERNKKIKRISDRMTYCPTCGSTNIFWASGLPQLWSLWECKECNYKGAFVLEDGTLGAKLRKEWKIKG